MTMADYAGDKCASAPTNYYVPGASVKSPEKSVSENVLDQLKRVVGIAHNNAAHSSVIADRMIGPTPETAHEGTPPTGPAFFDQLREIVNELEAETRRTDSNLQRISKCFG